jgi:hypothetical protein
MNNKREGEMEYETLEKCLLGNDDCTVDADWVWIFYVGTGSGVRMEMAGAKFESDEPVLVAVAWWY